VRPWLLLLLLSLSLAAPYILSEGNVTKNFIIELSTYGKPISKHTALSCTSSETKNLPLISDDGKGECHTRFCGPSELVDYMVEKIKEAIGRGEGTYIYFFFKKRFPLTNHKLLALLSERSNELGNVDLANSKIENFDAKSYGLYRMNIVKLRPLQDEYSCKERKHIFYCKNSSHHGRKNK